MTISRFKVSLEPSVKQTVSGYNASTAGSEQNVQIKIIKQIIL